MVVVQMPEAATFEGGKAKPMLGPPMPRSALVALVIGVVLPFLALLATIPVVWG